MDDGDYDDEIKFKIALSIGKPMAKCWSHNQSGLIWLGEYDVFLVHVSKLCKKKVSIITSVKDNPNLTRNTIIKISSYRLHVENIVCRKN